MENVENKDIDDKFSPRAKEDLELIRQALEEKSQKAYGRLLNKYKDSIYFTVLRMVHNRDDADDLTMEAFGKAFRNLKKYNPQYAFSTWLFRIATNNCIDFIRKKRLETTSIDQPISGDDDVGPIPIESDRLDPEEKVIKNQRTDLMRDVVEGMNPKYKALIELRYFEEYSYEEIALELDLPLGTVKAQLFRAKDLLYNILKNQKDKY